MPLNAILIKISLTFISCNSMQKTKIYFSVDIFVLCISLRCVHVK